jgi:hypothetical protein
MCGVFVGGSEKNSEVSRQPAADCRIRWHFVRDAATEMRLGIDGFALDWHWLLTPTPCACVFSFLVC